MHYKEFKKGLYRHYKGNEYQVIDVAKHSETEQWMVLYQPCYSESGLWVRPFEMFFESVEDAQGNKVARFALIKETN